MEETKRRISEERELKRKREKIEGERAREQESKRMRERVLRNFGVSVLISIYILVASCAASCSRCRNDLTSAYAKSARNFI